jgi:hypothetical protein
MKVQIEYESSWRNSFLEGSNNEPLPKKGRKFIASGRNLNDRNHPGNFIKHEVTLDTVMGILNRLIGDQRKLYQSRQDKNYYFQHIDSVQVISFKDNSIETQEVTYIRNITGSNDQNSYTGAIKTNDVIFKSNYSQELWGILGLDLEELYAFIIDDHKVKAEMELDPILISDLFDEFKKIKPVEAEGIAEEAVKVLEGPFPGTNYFNNSGKIVPSTMYCSSLYLQLQRLSTRGINISTALTKTGVISGISKRIFTKKDFMNRFTTGEKKKVWGNPYIKKERIAGLGEVVSMMTKASGHLEINIDIDRNKAKDFKQMVENAGVSSFYLGKKGLAYVTDIDTREVK